MQEVSQYILNQNVFIAYYTLRKYAALNKFRLLQSTFRFSKDHAKKNIIVNYALP